MNLQNMPPLAQSDLARLDQFLSSQSFGDSAMSLTFAHGFMTSIASGPEQLEPSEWLRLMFDEPVFADGSQSDDILGLAVRLYADIERGLNDGAEFRPVLEYVKSDDGEVRVDAQRWCLGFVQGLSLFQELWTTQSRKKMSLQLQALFELAEIRGSDDTAYQEMCGLIPDIARATHNYWQSTQSN